MNIHITGVKISDASALVKHLHDREIYRRTLRIPYPYGLSDARWFINDNITFEKQHHIRKNWAIRDGESNLMGVIGLHFPYGLKSHINEVGYWLGREHWGKGIMTDALSQICDFAFQEMAIKRLQATIFEENLASARVLAKNGFTYEGTLKNYYLKDQQLLNGQMYAKFPD